MEDKVERKNLIKETFRHDQMSNQVVKAQVSDTDTVSDPFKDAEISQPKSMKGHINVLQMGIKARTEPLEDSERNEIKIILDNSLPKEKHDGNVLTFSNQTTVLDLDQLESVERYIPSTEVSQSSYSKILDWVNELLGGDLPHDTLNNAAILCISILKNGLEKSLNVSKKMIEDEIGKEINDDDFKRLEHLVDLLDDFTTETDISRKDKTLTLYDDNESDTSRTSSVENILIDQQPLMADESNQINALIGNLVDKSDDETYRTEDVSEISLGKVSEKEDSIIDIKAVTNDFLDNIIRKYTNLRDAQKITLLETQLFGLLNKHLENTSGLETHLRDLLGYENPDLIKFLRVNRVAIYFGTKYSKADKNSRDKLLREMVDRGFTQMVSSLTSQINKRKMSDTNIEKENDSGSLADKKPKVEGNIPKELQVLNLENTNDYNMTNKMTLTRVSLPEGSYRTTKQLYDEVHIPAPKHPMVEDDLILIRDLPNWLQKAFPTKETESLNLIQSRIFPCAFKSDKNMLICAPTGAGKTNVAVLSILRTISHYIDQKNLKLKSDDFKIVYIAPLKALVQEQTRELQRRLSYMNIKVSEFTGDTQLKQNEISSSHILVCTPEKWDVVTRKTEENFITRNLKLIIIDEIHLLGDERGPVLESIVARSLWANELSEVPRLVSLSATLPNFNDVAKFLRVPKEGVFYFDSSYRPCPLAQEFCAIRERNSLKALSILNQVCYDKTLESLKNGHQIIIFVHSRRETSHTARYLIEKCTSDKQTDLFMNKDAANVQILKSESENVLDADLKTLIRTGIGIHHAGLTRDDRSLSEDLFAEGIIRVLVSTATLAWGVNLPAHTVIIKGTDIYSPRSGTWEQLSIQDMLQMLGRAGRPRYDTNGEGIIITSQKNVHYFIASLNHQLPLESQLISKLVDNLNAEIVAGHVQSKREAIEWFSYTYMYVRMQQNPELYRSAKMQIEEEVSDYQFIDLLIHSALVLLDKRKLACYDVTSCLVKPTELGRIGSYFYVSHSTLQIYSSNLSKYSGLVDLIRIFSLSDEFKYITTRIEEKKDILEIINKVPIPISGEVDSGATKINILLQSYISKANFDGSVLNADMHYVTQNAGRLLRAMLEICLANHWAKPVKAMMELCRSVQNRAWMVSTPLRMFSKCPKEIIRRIESSTIPWEEYLALDSPSKVGSAIRSEQHGKLVYDLFQRFPKILMHCSVQPLTPSVLNFDVEYTPKWIWDNRVHNFAERFFLYLEDTDGTNILYHESLIITPDMINRKHNIEFSFQLTPKMQKRLPPNFFVIITSERWWNCSTMLAVSLEKIILPKKYPPLTLLDHSTTIRTDQLYVSEFADLFNFQSFNPIQSAVFERVYNSNLNVMVSAPEGSGKTVIAELCLLNHWKQNKGRAVYISSKQEKIDMLITSWNKRFKNLVGGKTITKLTNNIKINLKLIAISHVILATPEQYEFLSRRWTSRKNIQQIELVIYDDLNCIGTGNEGALYETLITRQLFICDYFKRNVRLLGLSSSIANAPEVADWIRVDKTNLFNYHVVDRLEPLDIELKAIHSAELSGITTKMLSLALDELKRESSDVKVFVLGSNRQGLITHAAKLLTLARKGANELLRVNVKNIENIANTISDKALRLSLLNGIGFVYPGMLPTDRDIVFQFYESKIVSILLVPKFCPELCPYASTIILIGTRFSNLKESRHMSYTINEILGFIAKCKNTAEIRGKIFILTDMKRKSYYEKFLSEPIPVESSLAFGLHEFLSNEICNITIQNNQNCLDWILYSYFYRRLHSNPSYYGLTEVSQESISLFLSEVITDTLSDLEKNSLIKIEELPSPSADVISPLAEAKILSNYNVNFETYTTFLDSLDKYTSLRDILLAISDAAEFDVIHVLDGELSTLSRLADKLPLKFPNFNFDQIGAFKVFVLLQAHFSRLTLSLEYAHDLSNILSKCDNLINCIIDLLIKNGSLSAMKAMDISQMLIQANWDTDNALKQIPYFDESILAKCEKMGISTVYDIMALDDDERDDIMTLDEEKLILVADFINNYPNIELHCRIDSNEELHARKQITINIKLVKDNEPETLEVTSIHFPERVFESWWLLVGNKKSQKIYTSKKVVLSKQEQMYDLNFVVDTPGKHEITTWAVCNSYQFADKEYTTEAILV